MTVTEMAHQIAATRQLLPLRVCYFCQKALPWAAYMSERYGQPMHPGCAITFDWASRRILSHIKRLGYQIGICGWCGKASSTLRWITVPFDEVVCAACRGVRPGEQEG